jgi:hypothetical protein
VKKNFDYYEKTEKRLDKQVNAGLVTGAPSLKKYLAFIPGNCRNESE